MSQKFYRDSWIEVDLANIAYNVQQLKKRLSNQTNIYAVVKADGYGHGDVQVAKTALRAGASALAVALLDEAIRLREAGISAPILVMGWVRPEDTPLAAKHDISVTMFQVDWLNEVKSYDFEDKLKLHMKWDTGMGRIGIREEKELIEVLDALDDERLELEGVFTHFATADEAEVNYYNGQNDRFKQLLKVFQSRWDKRVIIHTGNSAASMRFPEDMFHFVRFGISLYGLYPSPVVKQERPIDLKPALSLYSKITHVKNMKIGDSISYGATYTTDGEEWIATVPLGYADGIRRKLQGQEVLVDGERVPIVGRICMDQFMVRLNKPCPVGTKVTIIGTQNNHTISMDEIANRLDTINYEVACMISNRVPRTYTWNGNPKS
ncbi:alanine racemase [Aquibacillus koreensis]|uniref:Alanine racemase n=1 Tax=Aquibacillus koreensis TaxID=279446 RepID=A0A9X3WR46_9BACI|nr:alanine racemase [Aquibacillus koreensis]MCT2534960.1 alanine racemase [Aquibacillus koreensis]MDC3422146.1 alanine racemase [Aquibacillus koreensis]